MDLSVILRCPHTFGHVAFVRGVRHCYLHCFLCFFLLNVNSRHGDFLHHCQQIAHAGVKYLTSSRGVVPLDSFKTMLSALEN